MLIFPSTQQVQKTILNAFTIGQSAAQYTHSEHGTEVAEISEQLLHRGLLGINGKVLQHVVIQRLHVAVHYHQLVILLPGNLSEAVDVVVKVTYVITIVK